MKTLMRNGRDRRSENPLWATRGKNARLRLGPISGSHQGPQPERLHLEAGYMAAPVSFREKVRFFSLAPRAPPIHGTKCAFGHVRYGAALGGSAEVTRGLLWIGLGEPAYLSTQRLNSKTIGPACGPKVHGAFYDRRLVSPSHIEATRDAPAPIV